LTDYPHSVPDRDIYWPIILHTHNLYGTDIEINLNRPIKLFQNSFNIDMYFILNKYFTCPGMIFLLTLGPVSREETQPIETIDKLR
jgi:hypothetical protein